MTPDIKTLSFYEINAVITQLKKLCTKFICISHKVVTLFCFAGVHVLKLGLQYIINTQLKKTDVSEEH